MPYVTEGNSTIWRDASGKAAWEGGTGPAGADIISQAQKTGQDISGYEISNRPDRVETGDPSTGGFLAAGDYLKRKSGGGEATPAPEAPAAPASAGGGGGTPIASAPPSLAAMSGGSGGGAPSEGGVSSMLSGPEAGQMNLGHRMPPSLAALLNRMTY